MQAEVAAPANLAEWLGWQERMHPIAIDMGLDRVGAVAARMGLPAAGIRTVTVAGTNGKGSTTAMLAAIYRAAGYRTGSYSSPHLLVYNERVVIDGVPASDEQLCEAFEQVESARQSTSLTYFEFGTLAALHLFRNADVQVQVLEVGMGGRLDAVNLVDADAAIVTNIGLDHCEFLGNSRAEIASEKAGVLRRGRPAIDVDADRCPQMEVEARRRGADLSRVHLDFDYQDTGDHWTWSGFGQVMEKLPIPSLPGAVQIHNAAGALAAIAAIQSLVPVPENAVRRGLASVRLPGRMQQVGNVILDVGHNAEAARVLAQHLDRCGVTRVHLVLGMLADKPVLEFLRVLASRVVQAYAARLPGPRGLHESTLQGHMAAAGVTASGHESPVEAFKKARCECLEGDTILVCGSFLTVSAVLPLLK